MSGSALFITLLVLLRMLNLAFLRPIRIIAAHIREYVMEGNRKKEWLVIKGGYEVWSLSKSFEFMTNELDEYEEIRAKDIMENQRIATELDCPLRSCCTYMHFVISYS